MPEEHESYIVKEYTKLYNAFREGHATIERRTH